MREEEKEIERALAGGKVYQIREVKKLLDQALSSQLKEVQKYRELIMAVGNKYEGETRHETALRYIKQAEEGRAESAELSQLAEVKEER